MRKVIVKERQSVADIAIQYCGDVEAIFEIAKLNDISTTELLSAGREIVVPDVINNRIVDYYANNNIEPATAGNDDSQLITIENEYLITLNGEKIIENE